MSSLFKKLALFLLGLVVLCVVGLWLLLSSSLLAGPRGALVARVLQDKLGQDVAINGGVTVDLGSVLHITAQDVVLLNDTNPDSNLADLVSLDFDLAARDLMQGRVTLSNLTATGARVTVVVDENGHSGWTNAISDAPANTEVTNPQGSVSFNPLSLLSGQGIQLSDSSVLYQDARNGLDLDVQMSTFGLTQETPSAPLTLSGSGALNGETFDLDGTFAKGDPFSANIRFDQMRVDLSGDPTDGGYVTSINAELQELGQLLDALKLQRPISGNGKISAKMHISDGPARVTDVNVAVALDTGQSLTVTGELGEMGNAADVSLDTRIRLYPDDALPPPATLRRDLKLVGVDMTLEAQPNGIPKRGMVIATNGFVLDTTGEGPPPVEVSGISRTPDGLLRLGNAVLRIGPPDAPFLVVEGAVEDALRLEGIDFGADLLISASSLIAPEGFAAAGDLGKLVGGFRLKGNAKVLSLSELQAKSQGSDLWHLDVTGSVHNALKFEDVDLHVKVDVPSGAKLLETLELKPIDTGLVQLAIDLTSQDTAWETAMAVDVGDSELDLAMSLDMADPHPVVRGTVESDLIRINHLRDIAASALQLSKLNPQAESAEEPADTNEIQPLVLSKEEPASGPLRDVTLEPLGRTILLSGMDLSVQIDLRKLEGDAGTTSLQSAFEFAEGKAQLGPVDFSYGGGHFNITGLMDMKEDPDTLRVEGSTDGWDFGEIMQAINFKKPASGVVNGEFKLQGHHKSVKDFLATMQGSAFVSMRNGTIDTQLLDIAGLGVLPWLFSKERGKTAPIVCARAPLYFSNGQVSTKQIVVETDQVQVVVFGNVNLKGKTLDITGQPRRIGKPLSRSPWPFTLKGSLNDPKVKVKDGPRRLKRSDGASKMPENRKLCVPDILQLQ
ncbi:AsmA family protein [Falsiruegeria mediterranea]